MGINDIRKKYLDAFKKEDHVVIPSSRLVPENDPTTLFTGSGMQPLLPNLLGDAHPQGTRLVDSQKCFRGEDIDEVGDNRHTTFFEMLGNWSLGDYFKAEQLRWYFEFLTDSVGLDPSRLYVTVYAGDEKVGIPRDEKSVQIWQKLFQEKNIQTKVVELLTEERAGEIGMQGGRIFYYDAKKNWWSRSGAPENMPEGEPGGPDSEVFYEFTDVEHDVSYGKHCHPNCDCGRFMEIGNSVFMEYIKQGEKFVQLPQKNVDFGGGLERIAAAQNNTSDMFMIDVFQPLIQKLEEISGSSYKDKEKKRAFRIVADHMRGIVFMIGEGLMPSNTDQGYVVRRLLRRAIRFADMIGVEESSLVVLVDPIVHTYKDAYPLLIDEQEKIKKAISDEESKFRRTLSKGIREFKKLADQNRSVSGKDAFILFSTYGFPKEMTQELADESGIQIDSKEYEEEFKKHQLLSRTASAGKFKGGLADHSEHTTSLHTVTHLMLAGLRKYLGDHVHQAGSNITAERTRFDFTHHEKVDREILDKVEAYVNEAIQGKCTVSIQKMKKEEAKEKGVEGSFWEKYPDMVNVYTIQDGDGTIYSQELCGGPHVESTQNISGTFKIKKEESSSAGVRRIKAILE